MKRALLCLLFSAPALGCGSLKSKTIPTTVVAQRPTQAIEIRHEEGVASSFSLAPTDAGFNVLDGTGASLGTITIAGDRVTVQNAAQAPLASAKKKKSGFRVYGADGKAVLTFKITSKGLDLKSKAHGKVGKLKNTKGTLGKSKLGVVREGDAWSVQRDGQRVALVAGDIPEGAVLLLGLTQELAPNERLAALLARAYVVGL